MEKQTIRKSRLASFLDACLVSSGIVLITLILLSRIKMNLLPKLLLPAVIASIAFMLYIKREKKRYINQQIKFKDKLTFTKTIDAIYYMTTQEKSTYFSSLFNKLETSEDYKNIKICYYLLSLSTKEKEQVFQEIIDKSSNTKYDKFFVITLEENDLHNKIEKYKTYANKNIILLSPEDLYKIIKKYNMLPSQAIEEKKKPTTRQNIKLFFQNLLYKSNAKGFFISGLLLLFSSLFIPFKTYYQTISLILLSISTICLIFGKKTQKV